MTTRFDLDHEYSELWRAVCGKLVKSGSGLANGIQDDQPPALEELAPTPPQEHEAPQMGPELEEFFERLQLMLEELVTDFEGGITPGPEPGTSIFFPGSKRTSIDRETARSLYDTLTQDESDLDTIKNKMDAILNPLPLLYLYLMAERDTTKRLLLIGPETIAALMLLWHCMPAETTNRLTHPVAALMEAWLLRPELIKTDDHQEALLHAGLMNKPPATISTQPSLLPHDELPRLGRVEQPAALPLFPELPDSEYLLHTLLILANAAGFNAIRSGRGARIDKRLLIYTLISMPRNQRRAGGRYEWRPTLRELRDLLWPLHPDKHGRLVSSFRPGTHGPALMQGLQAVNIATIQLPNGDYWQPVHVWQYPTRDLDRETIIEIRLPDACDHGAAIDRPALIAAGAISDPAFNIEIGLAYIWDEAKARNAGYRIYTTQPEAARDRQGNILDARGQLVIKNGRPSKNWNDPAAVRTGRHVRHPQANKVRVLTREDRRRLAYGPETQGKSKSQITNERNNADRLLIAQETAGRITIERDAVDDRTDKSGWRILQNWGVYD